MNTNTPFDLHFHSGHIEPLTRAGEAFLRRSLLNGQQYQPRDYQNATAEGLRVSFESQSDLTNVSDWHPFPVTDVPAPEGYESGDPGSTSGVYENEADYEAEYEDEDVDGSTSESELPGCTDTALCPDLE